MKKSLAEPPTTPDYASAAGSPAWFPTGDNRLLADYLPGDHSLQSHSFREATRLLDQLDPFSTLVLLDLGCGAGTSYEKLCEGHASRRWIGLDIEDSPEARSRKRLDLDFRTFDGINIPLPTESVHIVYSHQVFEHVRHPQELLAESYRVLMRNGYFVGSTSHLEPFHSRSFWNFTPYGFCDLLRSTGFRNITVRPGIDGPTLITRRLMSYFRLSGLFQPFFVYESPLNLAMEAVTRLFRMPAQRRNCIKLQFCGHFSFTAEK